MALAADRTLDHEGVARRGTGTLAGTVFKGSIVSTDVSGTMIAAVDDTTVGTCMGIAEAGGTIGQAVAYEYDCLFWLPCTTITAADIGDNCYAVDDQTVDINTSLGPCVGQIRGFKTGYALVWVGRPATPHSTT